MILWQSNLSLLLEFNVLLRPGHQVFQISQLAHAELQPDSRGPTKCSHKVPARTRVMQ